jgi:hypothetical protein
MDFESVAIHEIGHALGFISEVDTFDILKYLNSPTALAPSTLDLFRFENNTANDPSDAASFSTATRSLMPGVDAITDDITGAGTSSAENRMSTGAYTGDGRQASHFKDNLAIGVMDPTLSFGEVVPISDADLRALDLIGYEISFGQLSNSAPVANDDSATVGKKSGVADGNVLDNDTDANGDTLTATLVDGPTDGNLVFNDDGSFTYTPGSSFSGSDTFTYYANDAEDDSNVATVTISSKGGGGSKSGGGGGKSGGGNPGGGGGGGGNRPNRLETIEVGLSPPTLASLNDSLSVYQLPHQGSGQRQSNAVSAIIVATITVPNAGGLGSAESRFADDQFGSEQDSDEQLASTPSVTARWNATANNSTTPVELGGPRQDSESLNRESTVDQVMAELEDLLTLPI